MIDYTKLFLDQLKKHKNHEKWDNETFKEIKLISNTKVGSVGQDFIEQLSKNLGFECEFPLNKKGVRATQSPWDIKINGVSFELKTATEDVGGNYQFNHFRYHRPYEAVLCLGVSPNALFFSVWSKADLTTGKAGNLVSMERGANASYKLTKKPRDLLPISSFETTLSSFTKNFK